MNTFLLPRLVLLAAPIVLSAQTVIQLETVQVTAQKRVQAITDVPISLTAHTGTFLERVGVTDYKALAPFVPGLFIQEQSPNNPGINLRGITTDSGDPRGEARISIFQDGVSISRSRASVVELFDLERIEVLKGPQGTLFGRGAEIGALALVQNKAKNLSGGSLTAGVGSDDERRVTGFVNAPLIDGTLFGRVAWMHAKRDGSVANLVDGSTLNGKDTHALRLAVRWQPAEATAVDVLANWQHDTPPGTAFKSGVIPTSRGDTDPFAAAELTRGRALGVDRTVGGVTAILVHELNPAWTLTTITGWREYDSFEQFDADGSGLYLLEFAEDARGRQFSQEVRVNVDAGGRFAGFLGASWFDEKGSARVPFMTDERQLWPFLSGSFRGGLLAAGLPSALVNFAVPTLNPFAPQSAIPATFAAFANPALPPSLQGLARLAGAPLLPYREDQYTQTGRTRALDIFADGTWRVTDRFELTAGLRFTRESVTSGYEASNGAPPTLGFIVNAIPGYPFLPTAGRRSASDDSSAWDGRLVGRFALTPTLNAYASVSRGHRPSSLLLDSTTTLSLREETVLNHEVGIKGSAAGGQLQWSAAAYRYNYGHFQTAVLSLGRFTLMDAGNATGRGFEAAMQGRLSERWSVFANYAYTKATFDQTDDDGQAQQYAGYTFRLTPRHAGTLGATYTLPLPDAGKLSVTPRWSYKGEHFFDDNNATFGGGLRQGGFSTVSLSVAWRSPQGRWEVTGRAENLFDEHYLIDAGNVGGSFGLPTFVAGDPRRVGAQITFNW